MKERRARTEIRLLGPVAVARDGEPLELPPSNKALALLAYLLVTGREHTRTGLSALLWEDVADPRGSLRWCLSRLRPLLEEDGVSRLEATRDMVSVDARGLRVDLLEVRALVADAGASLDALAEAEGRFRGAFLEDLDLPDCPRFHAWCVAEREDARVLHGALLDRLVQQSKAEGPERALEFARRRASLLPNDEDAEAVVIELLVTLGRDTEADDRFRAAQHRLERAGRRPGRRLTSSRARASDAPAPAPLPTATISQEVRFATTRDSVPIAYATAGSGPLLIKTASWLNHLEYEGSSLLWRHWLRALTQRHRLLRYDARGTGLSVRESVEYSFDAFVEDFDTVVRAAAAPRYSIVAISQGAAIAIAHAAAHPESVEKLVIVGGFSQGWRNWGERRVETGEGMAKLMAQGWGQKHTAFRQLFTSLFFPSASPELAADFNELQRRAASPEHAAAIFELLGRFDVTELMSRVRAPTLVFHARKDAMVPFREGQRIASGIPGARLVTLESVNHLLLEDEPAWPRFVEELRRFLDE